MARVRRTGDGRVDEAMAMLIQNQASFLSRIAEMDRISTERFSRVESILLEQSQILGQHSQILAERSRMLRALPEAVRDKIGFIAS